MTDQPLLLILESTIDTSDLTDTVTVIFNAMDNSNLTPVLRWELSGDPSAFVGTFAAFIDKIKKIDFVKKSIINARLVLSNDLHIFVYRNQAGGWKVELTFISRRTSRTVFITLMQKMKRFSLDLLRKGRLQNAHISRKEAGLSCVPFVPIAKTYPLVVTTDEEVNKMYADPKAFWAAGWDAVESVGDKIFLVRAVHAFETSSYLSEIIEHQWSMARASKPRLTEYFAPQPTSAQEKIFYGGRATLIPVAHFEDGNIVEYSCCIPENDHVWGWEIFNLRAIIQDGSLQNGLPVETVRVVFCRRELAEREKRPLMDIGARVYYQGNEDIIEIEE